ncbi:low-density lipoprotein receptor-related protein 11 [Denticeps clupeoides]|uniref:Low-density lipoprotein receptor-related protein 11 n=1 Tax=Denticeps clupeoides TaxID=299321 RepID=A0AAY4CMJ8_9TELE|nr:low-density lipoprotein receptor-related protein 11 [Denticeps clupeoides]
MALAPCLLLLCAASAALSRSPQISDLKSKISGVEELLEEFRKQLQQDQGYSREEDAGDACLGDFDAAEERIIRARDSIEQGAAFLSAPGRVYSWKDCLHACCSEPHCTVAVMQEDPQRTADGLSCYLFNCTYRGKDVCAFSAQQGFGVYSRARNATGPDGAREDASVQDMDEPPRSDAGQDVVVQLPTDWAVLDGRDSIDDHGVVRYDWTLVKGDPALKMKVTHPGLLKISGLEKGVYIFQLAVTDTAGQRSSDNVSVTVLSPEPQAEVCTGRCSRYQFMCDDGCCVDISFACDGKQQCPDRSDEAFCQNFDGNRKAVTHASSPPQAKSDEVKGHAPFPARPKLTMEDPGLPIDDSHYRHKDQPAQSKLNNQQERLVPEHCAAPPVVGPCKGVFPRWYYDQDSGECKHFIYGGCKGNHNNFLQETDCVSECIQKHDVTTAAPTPSKKTPTAGIPKMAESEVKPQTNVPVSKPLGRQLPPESGAILPLVLGIIISTLLLLMVGCRLRLVRHKLKKARPLTTEDYLINGMYL